jgi:hyaluronoglucosaminidase
MRASVANVMNGKPLAAGVIEGFFGRSWSWAARLDNIQFLRDWGYQFFIYAPKADAFLRRRWSEPIPSETMRHLRQLKRCCQQSGLALGVGLTPFEIYLNYDADAQKALRSKVLQINTTGAELLCILFDDMQGNSDKLAELQARVISDVCTWSVAENFIVCPTYYSDDPCLAKQFGSGPKSYLRELGRSVDSRVEFFWTGEKVISDRYSEQHLARVASQIGRKPFIWDNHISNDSKTRSNFLFLDPSADSWALPAHQVAGLAINPMNQPHLSRIALAGYRRLLSGSTEDILAEVCRLLCGPSLMERLLDDADLLQITGLAGLDSKNRATLLDRYSRDSANAYAQEICSWLRGEYAFDPQCLTS